MKKIFLGVFGFFAAAMLTAADALKIGVADDAAFIPDAFGEARTKRRFACGPLRVSRDFMLIMR